MSRWVEGCKLVPKDCLQGITNAFSSPLASWYSPPYEGNEARHQALVSQKIFQIHTIYKQTSSIPVCSAEPVGGGDLSSYIAHICTPILKCSFHVCLLRSDAALHHCRMLRQHLSLCTMQLSLLSAVCCVQGRMLHQHAWNYPEDLQYACFMLSFVIVYWADLFLLMLCSHLVVLCTKCAVQITLMAVWITIFTTNTDKDYNAILIVNVMCNLY